MCLGGFLVMRPSLAGNLVHRGLDDKSDQILSGIIALFRAGGGRDRF